jgi:hypothetical protein
MNICTKIIWTGPVRRVNGAPSFSPRLNSPAKKYISRAGQVVYTMRLMVHGSLHRIISL